MLYAHTDLIIRVFTTTTRPLLRICFVVMMQATVGRSFADLYHLRRAEVMFSLWWLISLMLFSPSCPIVYTPESLKRFISHCGAWRTSARTFHGIIKKIKCFLDVFFFQGYHQKLAVTDVGQYSNCRVILYLQFLCMLFNFYIWRSAWYHLTIKLK